MKKILLSLLVSIALYSCEEQQELVDYTLRVGSIYCADGKIYPLDVYQSEKMDHAVGIISYVAEKDNEHNIKAIAVALQDLKDTSFADTTVNVSNANSDNGNINSAALLSDALKNNYNVPGVASCIIYSDKNVRGWHLPSIFELKEINRNIYLINDRIEIVGGNKVLDKWYMSSSQDTQSNEASTLYCLSMNLIGSSINSSMKEEILAVRPVIIIR